jgi:hypothetical protein
MRKKILCIIAWNCFFLLLLTTACPDSCDHNSKDYTITGNIKVTNDCDGQLATILDNVWIETELMNSDGTVGIPGRTLVHLVPDPTDPNNPVKIGTYSITLQWTSTHKDAGGPAVKWQYPEVNDQQNGTDICFVKPTCPPGTGPCYNVATGTDIPAANPPSPTNYNIEIVCACN